VKTETMKKLKKLIRFTDDYQNKEEIILRDHLALERTKLANERTLLSYLRTSLYLFLGGLALLEMADIVKVRNLGFVSIFLSVIFLIIGIFRYNQLKKHMKSLYKPLKNNQEKTDEIKA
jgi:putative membrane protein